MVLMLHSVTNIMNSVEFVIEMALQSVLGLPHLMLFQYGFYAFFINSSNSTMHITSISSLYMSVIFFTKIRYASHFPFFIIIGYCYDVITVVT